MFKIAQTTPDPSERNLFVKKAFELLDMRGFDELLTELSEIKKLQSTINQMREEIDRSNELSKQYENSKINAEVRVKIMAKYIQLVESLLTETEKIKHEIETNKLRNEVKELEKQEKQAV